MLDLDPGIHFDEPEIRRRRVVQILHGAHTLKDPKFRMEDAVLVMIGECHPCSRLEETLGVGGYNATRAFGAITAKVLTRRRIGVGEAIVPIDWISQPLA